MWQDEVQLYCLIAWRMMYRVHLWCSPCGYYFSSGYHPLVSYDTVFVQDNFGNLVKV